MVYQYFTGPSGVVFKEKISGILIIIVIIIIIHRVPTKTVHRATARVLLDHLTQQPNRERSLSPVTNEETEAQVIKELLEGIQLLSAKAEI